MRRLHNIYCILCLGYLLGVYRGQIALWKDPDPTPIRVFPYSISMLPEEDQQTLRKGIHADSIIELTRQLEDYLSQDS
jgi:hypothetical protein